MASVSDDIVDSSSSVSHSDEGDFAAWDDLMASQTAMYKTCVKKNTLLRAQVSQLQDELEVWKIGFNAKAREKQELEAKVAALEHALGTSQQTPGTFSEREKDELETKVAKLERSLTAIHEEHPLVVCLIDGDGAVFSESYLTRGKEGGREAAATLNAAIKSHVQEHNHNATSSSSRITSPQIICTIYFNRMGLCKTLLQNEICTAQNFLDFFVGFNQASPTFCLVDAGDGKEAADAKLRESLKIYARLPQTRKVIFGGVHDNGYIPPLISLATEDLLDKLVMLKGYSTMAHEFDIFLRETNVDIMEVPGLFLQQKMPRAFGHFKSPSFSHAGGRVTPEPRSGSPSKQAKSPKKQKEKAAAASNGIGTSAGALTWKQGSPPGWSFPNTPSVPGTPASPSEPSTASWQQKRPIDPSKPLSQRAHDVSASRP